MECDGRQNCTQGAGVGDLVNIKIDKSSYKAKLFVLGRNTEFHVRMYIISHAKQDCPFPGSKKDMDKRIEERKQ